MGIADFGKVTAIVLAGGKSSRMGGIDKSMLEVKGVPIIQYIVNQLETHFGEVIIGANDIEKYGFLGHRVVPDIEPGKGPLMGIFSCLAASSNDLCFITACDIPEIRTGFIMKMLEVADGADIVMPVSGETGYEPMYGLYRKSILGTTEELLRNDKLKIADLFGQVVTRYIPFEGDGWYRNLNYREDYLTFSRERE
ncbi:MAG: molybdenum cofactor guanylyltransferase [Bacteroidales bacterium]|nr:molybdenum cofactor guanylyltransferase [Bacteroidales bacterium]